MTATKKTRIARTTSATSSTLRLDLGEVAHVGVDVHKASYHVAVVTSLRGLVATWTQPACPDLLVERLKPFGTQVAQVVYEAGPTGFALARPPVDGMPVRRTLGSRTSEHFCRRHVCLSPRVGWPSGRPTAP